MSKKPSINDIIMMFHNQALLHMGVINLPDTNIKKDMNIANEFIDYIEIIKEKTQGNLDKEEEKQITDILMSLKMLYVKLKNEDNKKEEES